MATRNASVVVRTACEMKSILLLAFSTWTAFAFSPQRGGGVAISPATAVLNARGRRSPFRREGACATPPSSSSALREKPGWLEDAMDGDAAEGGDRPSEILPTTTKPGLAGFALDPTLGFCAVLATDDGRFAHVVVSSTDRDRLESAEATTMVQLAGGLDLGTAVLPPDLLARLVADELRDGDGDGGADPLPVVALARIDAVFDPYVAAAGKSESASRMEEDVPPPSEERGAAIRETAPRVWAAVKGLPGLSSVKESQVRAALEEHADGDGGVDRDAFSAVLDSVRRELNGDGDGGSGQTVSFRLVANVVSGDSVREVEVETTNPLHALGLGMRHGVGVDVVLTPSSPSDDGGEGRGGDESPLLSPIETVLEKFPAFRPMSELLEDAKIMDGFIPGMFKGAIDNDMKG